MKLSTGFRGVLLAALAVGLRAEEKPAGEPAKSGNWLVDAMADSTADSRSESKPGGSLAEGASRANASRSGSKPGDGAVNPLSSYLTTWMTPRDVEILKIKGADAHTPGIPAGSEQDRMVSRGTTPEPRTNPYLTDPVQAPTVVKAPPSLPAPPPPSLATPALKNDAAPAKVPSPPADLLKSQDDSKYFPQLKHF